MSFRRDWFPEVQVDPRTHGVPEAEKTLSHGNYVATVGSTLRGTCQIKTLQNSRDPLATRAERALPAATARSNSGLALEQEGLSEVLGQG